MLVRCYCRHDVAGRTFERQKNGGWVVFGHVIASNGHEGAAPYAPDFGFLTLGYLVELLRHGLRSIAKVAG